jgi:hypothetical protein
MFLEKSKNIFQKNQINFKQMSEKIKIMTKKFKKKC